MKLKIIGLSLILLLVLGSIPHFQKRADAFETKWWVTQEEADAEQEQKKFPSFSWTAEDKEKFEAELAALGAKTVIVDNVLPMTELTPEVIKRLQKYPYYQLKPDLDFKEIMQERPDLAAAIAENIFSKFNLFKPNEKFYTDKSLTYRAWNASSVIRGVLQTRLENGDIIEQDVEYEYYYGGWGGPKFIFEEMRPRSYRKLIKPDIPDIWAETGVKEALDKNLVPMALQNFYKANITRRDFCILAVNLIEVKTGRSIDIIIAEKGLSLTDNPFSDTTDKGVIAANKLGIVNGKGNGVFDPTGNITRQEAAVMLKNAAEFFDTVESSIKSNFVDNSNIASWAKNAVDYVFSNEIMLGVGNNKFGPKGQYSRQQAFITMLKLYKLF